MRDKERPASAEMRVVVLRELITFCNFVVWQLVLWSYSWRLTVEYAQHVVTPVWSGGYIPGWPNRFEQDFTPFPKLIKYKSEMPFYWSVYARWLHTCTPSPLHLYTFAFKQHCFFCIIDNMLPLCGMTTLSVNLVDPCWLLNIFHAISFITLIS